VKLLERGHRAITEAGTEIRSIGPPEQPNTDSADEGQVRAGLRAALHPFGSLAHRLASRGVPRRTVRVRLALAYGILFLVCGAALLGISYFFVSRFQSGSVVHLTPSNLTPSSGNVTYSPGPLKSAPPGSGVYNPVGNHTVRDFAVQAAVQAQRSADLHSLLVWFAVALGVMAVISVLLGWVMGGRVLRPLQQITTTARHISEENLDQRLALAGPKDEITDLADTIDGLLGRLQGAFDAQRAFVANASHELRTPLAMMRTSLDVAAGKSPPISKDASVLSAKVREGLDQAEHLVESFLVLARAQQGVIDNPTTVSLPEITTETLAARAHFAATASVALRHRLDQADVVGSRTLLLRLAANLIDNAINYNQAGGWVQATTAADGPSARLIVENSGPVLDPAEVDRLSDPFRRGGTDRTGSDRGVGLGLSIVAAIAAAHGGTIELRSRAEGGMRVTVTFPRPADHAQHPGSP
jgi:signal transduction histidine kinase